nr:lipopolysaccharide biosynthesis protein [Hyphomonas sp. Mor2]
MNEDRQQVGASIAWMAMGNWVEQAFNVLIFVILARLLGVEAFGLIAMAAAIVVLCEFLVRETLTEYLVASPNEDQAHSDAVFYSLNTFSVVLFLGLWGAAGPIAGLYQQDIVSSLIQYLGVSVLLVALGAVPASLLRRHMKFRALAIRAIAGVVCGGVVAIWMALNGYGVWALVAQRLVQVGVNTLLAWGAVSWRPSLSINRQAVREIFGLGRTVLALQAAQIARVQMPMALIGALLGPVVLGYFSLAWRLLEIAVFLISTPMRMVSQSAFAARLREGRPARTLLLELSRLSGWIAFPAMFGMMVLSGPVVSLVFGEKWGPAASALSIIGVVGAYLSIEMVHQSYCLAARKIGALACVAWLEVGMTTGAIAVVHQQGLSGVSYGFAASFLVLWGARFAIVSNLSGVGMLHLVRQHLLPLLISAGMAVMVSYVVGWVPSESALLLLASGALLGVLLYGLASWRLMPDRVELARQYFLRT